MPDENNLAPVIQTNADPAGAQNAETQLDNDIAKAKALSDAYSECEARLKSLRTTIAAPPANTAPGEINASDDTALLAGLLGWITMGIEAAQRATRAVYPIAPSDKKPTPSADENQSGESNSKLAPAAAVDLESRNGTPGVAFRPENGGEPKTPASRATQPAPGVYSDNDQPQNMSDRPPDSSAEIVRAVADHSQSLQTSEDRVRAALEQNTQITISLLNRILGLIDSQNRKLSEVDLKTNELSSQIKSLKNP